VGRVERTGPGRVRPAGARRPTKVAIGGTVSELLGLVAAALPTGRGSSSPEVEFTSNLFPWLVHADRGVEVVTVPTDRLVDSVTPGRRSSR
jgi:selenocysteine lyase/cysteine desulfurase